MNRQSLLKLAAGVSVVGCTSGVDKVKWVEQAKLHDGSMIDVSRTASRHSSGFPDSRRGQVIDYSVGFGSANWEGEWNRIPGSLEVFDGVPHLMVFIGDSYTCKQKSPEDYAALFFKYVAGKWEDVAQVNFPTSVALVNLIEDLWGQTAKDDPSGYLSWDEKPLRSNFNASHPYTIDSFFERSRNRICRWVQK